MAKKGGVHESVLHSHRNHLYDPVLNHDRNHLLHHLLLFTIVSLLGMVYFPINKNNHSC